MKGKFHVPLEKNTRVTYHFWSSFLSTETQKKINSKINGKVNKRKPRTLLPSVHYINKHPETCKLRDSTYNMYISAALEFLQGLTCCLYAPFCTACALLAELEVKLYHRPFANNQPPSWTIFLPRRLRDPSREQQAYLKVQGKAFARLNLSPER